MFKQAKIARLIKAVEPAIFKKIRAIVRWLPDITSEKEKKKIYKQLSDFLIREAKVSLRRGSPELTQLKVYLKKVIKVLPKEGKSPKKSDLVNYDFAFLSSSCLLAGQFNFLNDKSRFGELTITFKVGKMRSYTYPKVPKEVWQHMKQAKGQNGTGAMSVFWREFLWPNGYGTKHPRRRQYRNLAGYIRTEVAPFFKKVHLPIQHERISKNALMVRKATTAYQKRNKTYVRIRRLK